MFEGSRVAKRLLGAFAAVTMAVAATFTAPSAAVAAENNYAAMVVDAKTGEVLFSRNADAQRYPASLTKVMTLYLLFEDLERGRLSLNTRIEVSANAAAQAPTSLGLAAGQTIRVEDAILALVTKSANDVAMAVAESLAGSQSAFAQRMNQTARALGMNHTTFRNPHGLPDSGQITTARDMITLGRAIQDRFPQYYPYFATEVFVWNGTRIGNHNNLLGSVEGVNGIKTGYTRASGFNLLTSVNRDGRQVVAIVMGGNTAASRDAHMRELIETYLPRASTGPRTSPLLIASVPASTPAPVPRPNPLQFPSGPDPMLTAAVTAPEGDPIADVVAQGDADARIGEVAAESITPTGEWLVQIGAPPTEAGAQSLLAEAGSLVPGLGSLAPMVETYVSGSATYYRARFAGFSSREAAQAACDQLERLDFDCYVPAS